MWSILERRQRRYCETPHVSQYNDLSKKKSPSTLSKKNKRFHVYKADPFEVCGIDLYSTTKKFLWTVKSHVYQEPWRKSCLFNSVSLVKKILLCDIILFVEEEEMLWRRVKSGKNLAWSKHWTLWYRFFAGQIIDFFILRVTYFGCTLAVVCVNAGLNVSTPDHLVPRHRWPIYHTFKAFHVENTIRLNGRWTLWSLHTLRFVFKSNAQNEMETKWKHSKSCYRCRCR